MLKTLSLILPVLIPSWRFFKAIEPSPRVQWTLLADSGDLADDWQEFKPRPMVVTPFQMLCRLFWNPAWNDALFVVSCAERIALNPTPHSVTEIRRRILSDIEQLPIDSTDKLMQFRLVFVQRDETGLSQDIVFLSELVPATGPLNR
jgi:hypothetical protein